jgi:hypothetical protein
MNSPPEQVAEARERTEAFIAEHSGPAAREPLQPIRRVEPVATNRHAGKGLEAPPGRGAQGPGPVMVPDPTDTLRLGGMVDLNAPNGSTHER